MTPPPDKTPQNDDPLGGMDPLKWLESLAARQGANPEEFLTSADMEVAEVDPETVVLDEPGYVPSEPSSRAKWEREQATRREQDTARREQEAALRAAPPPMAVPPPPAAVPPPLAAPAAAELEMDPLSGDIDPLKWLESLARRQGAKPEEFLTEANMDVAEVGEDVEIDEPGYVPSEITSREKWEREQRELQARREQDAARRTAPPPLPPDLALDVTEPAAPAAPPPRPAPPVVPPARPEPARPQMVVNPLEGAEVDPIAWLESLARRQGANPEELITDANLEVPIPEDAVIDEPGYIPYSPFGAPAVSEPARPPERAPEAQPAPPPTPEPAAFDASGTLAWLENLAAEQGAAAPPLPPTPEPAGIPAQALEEAFAPAGDPLAGLSSSVLEQMAARNELTPEQWQAWLERQAAGLAATRTRAEAAAEFEEELPPPEPADIPAWLLESLHEEDATRPGEPLAAPPISEMILTPPEPTDLPDWLGQGAQPVDPALQALFEAGALAAGAPEEPALSEDTQPMTAPEAAPAGTYDDPWAQALDQEFRTRQMGEDEAEPEWYTSRISQADLLDQLEVEAEAGFAGGAEFAAGEEAEELEPAVPGEVPDWLSPPPAAVTAAALPAEADSDVPDWLTEQIMETSEAEIVDWLQAQEIGSAASAAPSGDVPEWLTAEVDVSAAQPGGLADWLGEAEPAAEVPEWLREAAPPEAAPEAVVLAAPPAQPAPALALEPPDDGAQELPAAEVAALLGLPLEALTPAGAPPQPEPVRLEPVRPEPAPRPVAPLPAVPMPAPQAAQIPAAALLPVAYAAPPPAGETLPTTLPEGAAYAEYVARLRQDEQDHAARLALARKLRENQEVYAALGQYLLITRAVALLDDVDDDLLSLQQQYPGVPQVYRLQGDVYLRQGRLQDALDTYRMGLDLV